MKPKSQRVSFVYGGSLHAVGLDGKYEMQASSVNSTEGSTGWKMEGFQTTSPGQIGGA